MLRPVADSSKRSSSDEKAPQRNPWRVEGARESDKPTTPERPRMRPPGSRRFWYFLLGLLVLNIALGQLIPSSEDKRIDVPYTFFRGQVTAGNVKEVNAKNDVIQGVFKKETKFEKKGPEKNFQTVRPTFAQDDELLKLLLNNDVEVNARPIDEGRSFLATLLISFGPTLLIVGLLIYFLRRSASMAGGGALALGRSKAKRYDASATRTTFEDVAGIDEAEEELVEIVDFLKNPDKYRKLGAAIPKGVLLSGPPGTGKTLLARAVAGEADVPFFSLSASEFVEMVVGVGASRVRDLFEQAKKAAPAIIFIDELDAIGRARGGGGGLRRPRRARADAQPDPHRDGRLHGLGGRHRARRDEPPGDPRPGAAAPRPLRPPRDGQPARQGRPQDDPEGPHALGAARRRRRPRPRSPPRRPAWSAPT